MKKFIYPAVFYDEGDGYSVLFPDFPCGTCGEDLKQAYEMAVDFLFGQLKDLIEAGQTIPKPTEMTDIRPAKDFEYKSYFTTLICVDLEDYEKYLQTSKKSVRKNITIPAWLSEKADACHINYSSVLQKALLDNLGL